ncbi:FAD binding protein [uncultured Eubacteriales bacterium]|uniref:FAD binding protein n=1 Tax=uncultured Eubacteriales bacterium TaxID=172733 RepID=A0A212IZD6_9FIRM|nr:FAD binding protein [uncultured Eubacteriales bacterium]
MVNEHLREIVNYDVAVLGAGPGGMAAAVSAARQGSKVVLVERLGYLGGQMASGLPFLAFLDMHKRQVVGGLAQKMVDDLAALDGTAGHRYCPFHLSSTTVNPFYTRIISFQWAKDYGIELLMHCEVSGVTVEEGRLTAVTVTGKGQEIEIRAKVFVDATGDGDLAYMAGAEYEKGQADTGVVQPPSLMFNLGGVDFDAFTDFIAAHPEELPYSMGLTHIREGYDADFFRNNPGHIFFGLNHMIQKLRAEGKCPINRDTVIYIRLPIPGHVAVNTIRIQNFDGSNIHDLSRGEQEAHLQILPLIKMLQENVPGFEHCYMTSVNAVIGVRESRRIMGIRKLTGQDCIDGVVPEDSIALYSYFIDIHNGAGEGTYTKTIEEPYGVPYGCLVSKNIDGLMMAGRCASVDAVAFGSTRIMTLCMAMGEAAGIGAALAIQQGISPKDVDVQLVRSILREHGGILEI